MSARLELGKKTIESVTAKALYCEYLSEHGLLEWKRYEKNLTTTLEKQAYKAGAAAAAAVAAAGI